MVLIEAVACGLPIITSNVGVASSLVGSGQGVFICPVGDKMCFVREIMLFLKDNTRRILFKYSAESQLDTVATGDREAYLRVYRESMEQCILRQQRAKQI